MVLVLGELGGDDKTHSLVVEDAAFRDAGTKAQTEEYSSDMMSAAISVLVDRIFMLDLLDGVGDLIRRFIVVLCISF